MKAIVKDSSRGQELRVWNWTQRPQEPLLSVICFSSLLVSVVPHPAEGSTWDQGGGPQTAPKLQSSVLGSRRGETWPLLWEVPIEESLLSGLGAGYPCCWPPWPWGSYGSEAVVWGGYIFYDASRKKKWTERRRIFQLGMWAGDSINYTVHYILSVKNLRGCLSWLSGNKPD